ncbi:MAG: helix-turn-helix domain-containing protein [Planctomycetota bacterium]
MFAELDIRRRELGVSYEALARMSGVSRATVWRILHGDESATFANVRRVAEALDVKIGEFVPRSTSHEYRKRQAQEKARRLVGHAQATAALEAQGVPEALLGELQEQTACELMAGPSRRIWSS